MGQGFKNDKRGVKVCKMWQRGMCSFGDRCIFNHGEVQYKPTFQVRIFLWFYFIGLVNKMLICQASKSPSNVSFAIMPPAPSFSSFLHPSNPSSVLALSQGPATCESYTCSMGLHWLVFLLLIFLCFKDQVAANIPMDERDRFGYRFGFIDHYNCIIEMHSIVIISNIYFL